ncbi:MAG: DNA lyase [Dictyoglomus sp. NZ13-RE01]|nr:MAG: DNA lyase [Dictyoglomus sp. NZ13-RE01]
MGKDIITKLREIEEKAKPLVDERIAQFKKLGEFGTEEELFSELSFCVLTANWSAGRGIKAQELLGINNFVNLTKEELEKELLKVGHRFARARSNFIVENRKLIGKIREIISLPTHEGRKYLVKNAKGIGWKEASHFLRNTGNLQVAILDKHILRTLWEEGLIPEIPKGWTEKRYLEIEKIFFDLSYRFGKEPGETDLYIWYLIKGKVEK